MKTQSDPYSPSSAAAALAFLLATGAAAIEPGLSGPARTAAPGGEPPVALSRASTDRSTKSASVWTSYPIDGGEMISIAAHPTDPATAWVGTRGAGVFKTVDGGQTWSPSRLGLTFYPIRTVVVDPLTPSTLYAGTDFDGVWKSTDGGATWFDSGSGVDDLLVIFNVVIDPADTDVVYAGGFGGVGQAIGAVYRSTDGGASWVRADAGMPAGDTWVNGVQALAIDGDDPQTLYAGTTFEGIYRSTDGGLSWAELNDGVPFLTPPDWRQSIGVLAVDPHHGGRPSAVIGTVGYYVLDADEVWQEIGHETLGGRRLRFHPETSDTVRMAGGGFASSTDGGVTWSHSGAGTLDMAFATTDPETIFGARDPGFSEPGGAYRSSDGGATWSRSGAGTTAQTIRSLATDPGDPNRLFAGTGHGFLYLSSDGGATWSRAVDADHPDRFYFGFEVQDVAADPSDPNRVFLAAGRLYRSLDGGASFAEVAAITGSNAIAMTPDGAAIYVGCSGQLGIFKSTDHGDSWVQVNEGLPLFGGGLVPVLSLAVDPGDPQTVWAGTQFSGGIVRSTDGGLTWQVMGLTDTNFVFAVAVNPADGDEILAGGGFWEGALYRSTDGGSSWSTILDAIAFPRDIVYDPLVPGHVYAATEGFGVLRSTDGGATWEDWSDGIFYPVLYALDIAPNRRLLTGSYGSGLYWLDLPPDPTQIFADGFESGDTTAWSSPGP